MRDSWAVVVAGVVTLVVAAGGYFGFQLERAGSVAFWALAVGPSVAFAVLAAGYAWRRGELGTWLRPAWGDATRAVLVAAILFAASYALARSFTGTPRESWLARMYLQIGDPKALKEHMAEVAAVIVVAAVAEEMVWRGLVTRLLEDTLGEKWAFAWAAVPYALAHLPTLYTLRDPDAGLNPLLPAAALGAGLVWGFVTKRSSGRLIPAIISHALFDWVVVMPFRLWGPSV